MTTRRTTLHAPVLIVGAGPAGLVTAIELARHGVRPLVIERHPSTSIFPRATGVSTRSMEIFRSYGHRRRRPPRRLAGHPARGPRHQARRSRRRSRGRSASPTRRRAWPSARRPRPSAHRTTWSRSCSSTCGRSAGGSPSRPSSCRSSRTTTASGRSIRDRTDGTEMDGPRRLAGRARTGTAAPSGAASASRWRARTTSVAT